LVVDALDDVSVQLELGRDGGWEVNAAGVQIGKSDRWSPAWRSRSSSRYRWASASVIDRIVALQRVGRASSVSKPRCRHWTLVAAHAASRRSRPIRC
jgi:hypothetical protein